MNSPHLSPDELQKAWADYPTVKSGDNFQHYKGGRYEIVDIGFIEANEEPAVVYRSLENGTVWVRTAGDFFEAVNDIPRFTALETARASHDSEILAEGKQVFTACAFIWHDFDGVKKVFLPKRADTKKFLPSVYELPGGHIDFGEDLKDGLKREIMEEFGMKINISEVLDVFTYTNDIKKSHSIEVVYFANFEDQIGNISINPEDHSMYGWFAADELHEVYSAQKSADDIEYKIIRKGFEKLEVK